MATDGLGEALTGMYPIPGGQARLYERGVVVDGAHGEVTVHFHFPMIGQPAIGASPAGAATALDATDPGNLFRLNQNIRPRS